MQDVLRELDLLPNMHEHLPGWANFYPWTEVTHRRLWIQVARWRSRIRYLILHTGSTW
jgi:hypothetical protein